MLPYQPFDFDCASKQILREPFVSMGTGPPALKVNTKKLERRGKNFECFEELTAFFACLGVSDALSV